MRTQYETSTPKEKLTAEHKRQAHFQRWFATFASLAHSRLPLPAYLQKVTDTLREVADVASAVVEWIEGEELVYRAASGAAAVHVGVRLPTAGSLSGLCITRQQALISRNTATDHRVDRVACEAVGAVSMVVAPVIYEGRSVAVLKLISGEVDHFGQSDIGILHAFCACIAETIAREEIAQENRDLLKENASVAADLTVESSLRIEYEKKLADALRRRQTVLDNAHVAFVSMDEAGMTVDWNEAAALLFGWKQQEVAGKELAAFIVPDRFRDAHRAGLTRYLATGEARMINQRVELPALRRDGSEFAAELTISEVWYEGQRQFACFVHDITDRRRATEANERLRLLINSVSDYAICMLDQNGYVRSWNDGARAIYGFTAAEAIGRHFALFYTSDEHGRDRPGDDLTLAAKRGRVEHEGWHLRRDGSEFWAHMILSALPSNSGGEQSFVKITRDMTARRRLEELEASSRRMNEFLALLGHELRNPLAPIRNAVSILKLKASDDADVIRSRQIVDRQLAHLTRLVDDLLEAGRVSSGKIRLTTDILDIADVVHLSVEASQPLFDERGQRIVVLESGRPLYVNGDPTRLVQALNNLLNNASKFSPPASTITLEVGPRGGSIMVRVIDQGRGISPEALGIVFDLFVQEHPPGAHPDEGGLGIGLTLVRAIAELHGGHVEAKSGGAGKGSAFSLWLPLAEPQADGAAADAATAAAAGHQLAVLVVDDNRDSADSMALLVEMLGHHARAAYDGPDALDSFEADRPQVVLLDLSMPGMTGFDVIRRMRDEGKRVIVAAMTGLGSDEDRARTRAAGFDAHLVKPVDLPELERVLALAGRA
ncbi:hybrid sensor histidine kinase/response regulator [Caballeronia ptereochthonis]|uniref:histidine kinase n=1 Tax=Caballeronia ptereochthonis TaxID=1777144 RepID=A0A157ZGH7_9BURK|nr:PAS domain S-box protein [Caballeronia ptereochthonis]SAK44618.1 PAS/PAC sensor hybrid histidine kinase [Caballeronia ptereochthonis]